jgi:hypothetical protein
MLEQETDRIIDTIAERTVGRRESVTLKEIITADIPRGVKIYVRTEVLHWLTDDLLNAPRFSRVNRNAPGVAQLINPFLRSLCNAYEFTREEFSSILSDAVHFCENHLCRPQWTLENFVFDKSTRIPAAEVLSKLEYAAEYTYFNRLIEKLLQQWNLQDVPRDEFRAMVAKIDSQVVRQHSAQELALLMKPIYDFLLVGSPPHNNAIPLSPVLVFLEDKGLSALRTHVESTCAKRGRSELTLRELTSMTEELFKKQSVSPDEVRPAAVGSFGAAEVTSRFAVLPQELPPPEVEAKEDFLQEPPERQTQVPLEPVEKPEPPAPPAPPPSPPTPPAQKRITQLRDLNAIIIGKDRNKIIRKLFRKDRQSYEAAITELNKMESWKEASKYLYEFFRTNQLDPYSDDVIEFTDLVQSRFTATNQ